MDLAEHLDTYAREGCVVVHNLIPESVCDLLALPLYADAQRMLESGFWPPQPERGDFGHGHVQLGPPRCAPWVHSDVVANPVVEQIAAAGVGAGAILGFYNGLCSLAGSGTQPLHLDSPWVWQDSTTAAASDHAWPPQSSTMTVCIAVDNIDESNGAEEIWPGSHQDLAAASFVAGVPLSGGAVERRRLSNPPTRLCIPKGAVAFRDARLWHRGLPNFSSRPRPMILMTYTSAEIPPAVLAAASRREEGYITAALAAVDRRLIFCSDCQEAFARPTQLVDRNARFVHGPVNHHRNVYGPGGAEEGASPSADDPTAELASHNHAGGWEQPDELSSIEIGSAADIYSNRSFLFGMAHGVPFGNWNAFLSRGPSL